MTRPAVAMLDREIQTYNEKLPELVPAQIGKFVLIKGDKLEGLFDTYADALRAGYEKHAQGEFLVKRVAPVETVAFFTRNLALECRT